MFMTTQPWRDEDYTKLISNLEPPPPPSNDGLWELQFCKWWGWNWVKKREEVVEEPTVQKDVAPKAVETKPPEKKPVKSLCRCLCFKKKKKTDPLQDKYNTPSNTDVDHKEQPQENASLHKEQPAERTNSILEKEIEEQITKDVANEVFTAKNGQKKKKRRSKEWSSSSTEECRCYCRDRNRSSTDESVEYINITCCRCCNHNEPSKEPSSPHITKTDRGTNEKYRQPEGKVMGTQTEIKEKRHRRKRICVVCCCNCKQSPPNHTPTCCACCSCGNVKKGNEKPRVSTDSYEPKYYKREKPLLETQEKNTFSTYRASTDQSEKVSKKPKHLRHKFEPLYVTGMPIDTMLYPNKPIPKFGIPSQNYSWIHATKSDIWDQFSHLRTSHEFTDLYPEKSANVSPIKLHDFESEASETFGPISIDKELETLKKIESDIKMDLKSRVMLDAVCDAILAKNKDPDTSSSIFLNEFTYPSNVTHTEGVMGNTYKSEQKKTCSKLNQTGLEQIIFEDTINKLCNSETNTSSINLSVNNQEKSLLRDYVNVRSPQPYASHNYNRRLFQDPRFSLNCSTYREHSPPEANKYPYKLLKYIAANDYPRIPPQRRPTITRAKFVPTSKRCASPTPRGRDIKKVKLENTPVSAELDKTNVSDIFKKIDEIVMRSKVNNEEIQTVLNTIPKKTYKFFTTWDVSNLMNQIPNLQEVDQSENVGSCVGVPREEKKEKNDKAKTPQTKKKKVCSKPSMIPKRVASSKPNKKNVGS